MKLLVAVFLLSFISVAFGAECSDPKTWKIASQALTYGIYEDPATLAETIALELSNAYFQGMCWNVIVYRRWPNTGGYWINKQAQNAILPCEVTTDTYQAFVWVNC